jgi:hypothetical protein
MKISILIDSSLTLLVSCNHSRRLKIRWLRDSLLNDALSSEWLIEGQLVGWYELWLEEVVENIKTKIYKIIISPFIYMGVKLGLSC